MAEENITTPVKTEAEIAAEQENEKKLYNRARNRAAFRIHLLIFILVNALFWVIYFFVFKGTEANDVFFKAVLFVTIAWLIILIGHNVFVRVFNSTIVEKELKKIKKEIENSEKELLRLKTIAEQKKAELLRKQQETTENQGLGNSD
ncbi:MAG: 2TM domain-containing protein [Bacteroidales bacterium]|nr:2TM domain-containing protein [Bacteroidales bacterium]